MRLSFTRATACCAAVIAVLAASFAARVLAAERTSDDKDHMDGHMTMTALRPPHPGDQERADAIVAAARKTAERYTDYRKALADGYTIFMPHLPQHVYHFTLDSAALAAQFKFDAGKPTSLLYEKTPDGKGYKLLGVMYTDRFGATEEELNSRVPLSIAQWHLHTNFCLPPAGDTVAWLDKNPRFGLQGSITTQAACRAAGGRFVPHVFGWMVHVYPFETDKAKIWSAGMDDDHGMQHDSMPGMKMGPGDKM